MPNGTLQVYAAIAGQAAPLAGVRLRLLDEAGLLLAQLVTDELGAAPEITLEAPEKRYSLEEDNTTVRPYTVYNIEAAKEGWQPITLRGVQIFEGQQTVARLDFLPTGPDDGTAAQGDDEDNIIFIPDSPLFIGGGGSGPAPAGNCPRTGARILQEVIIPKKITVHLGKPSANVRNVSVSFQSYIANVASSEVYPTWPEQALRANILAQISLALNRIWTEWYPSRGFNFNITGSPGYDQAYVAGRTIFAVMERLTAELFNTYVRRTGDAEPYYTEYCDGKTVSCPGMKQWGTVDRANAGLNALQILRYYYGSRVQLITTNNLAAIPSSYPGTPLRRGATGTNVNILQRQLARIAKDYPFFGKPAVTGTFDEATEKSVRAFQKQFSLGVDGVVGKATWYKISYIYVSVKDLAELTSEGEAFTGVQSAGGWPGVVLRRGATGAEVEQVQFWLSSLAQFDSALVKVNVDGNYGATTERAVRVFQEKNGLTADGVVGQTTWERLYAAWVNAQSDVGGTAYPGTALRSGAKGNEVRLVQFWLRMAAENYSDIPTVAVDGSFGTSTTGAVRAFQQHFGLSADGVVGRATWQKLNEVALAVANEIVSTGVNPGEFTVTTREGSSGTAVRAVQYYLRLLSAYYSDIPTVTVDGRFGAATTRAVRAWQAHAGLPEDGVVGPVSWQSIYDSAAAIAASGPVARVGTLPGPDAPAPAANANEGDDNAPTALEQLLGFLALWIPAITPPKEETLADPLTASIESAQRYFGLPITGTVGEEDWNVFVQAAQALYTGTPAAAAPAPEGVWPGYALAQGSAGPAVLQVQQWLNALGQIYCGRDFVPETGVLDAATVQVLEEYQISVNLSPLGVVDNATWLSLQAAAAPFLTQMNL